MMVSASYPTYVDCHERAVSGEGEDGCSRIVGWVHLCLVVHVKVERLNGGRRVGRG